MRVLVAVALARLAASQTCDVLSESCLISCDGDHVSCDSFLFGGDCVCDPGKFRLCRRR